MSYYVIIRGPLGIGKTTVSKMLAEALNADYISIDKVLEENNLDEVSDEEGCITAQNFIKGNEIIIPQVRAELESKRKVIIDGNFYHREQIDHLTSRLGYPHYVFTLKAQLDVCIDRDKKREKKYGMEAAMAVHELVSRFDYGTIIDTEGKNATQTVKEILSHLPKGKD